MTLYPGDNIQSLRRLAANSIDSVVCDPPYLLTSIAKRFGKEGSAAARTEGNDGSFARLSGGFMGRKWDSPNVEMPEIDADFANYMAGLIDGEGCFSVHKKQVNGYETFDCQFSITMRADDAAILYEMQRRLEGAGSIAIRDKETSNPQVRYCISSKRDCYILREVLLNFPLRAKKARDFEIWCHALDAWLAHEVGGTWEDMEFYRDQIMLVKRFGSFFKPELLFHYRWSKEVFRVLKPGGYIFAFSGSRTGHWQAAAMETAGFIMHPMHGWVFGCMDPETECLTRRGWLRYTDLLPTDEVLQWNSETDLLSWVVPQHIHEYDFDGQMVQIKNRHTHQVLTPNHRVYAKIRRHSRHAKPVAYEVIESRFVDSRPGNWQVNLPMASFLEGSQNFDVELAYLVGWWLTDAWAHKDANAVCFSQSKSATLAKLRDALSKWNPSEYVKKAKKATHADEHMFYLSGPLADLLRRDFPERKLTWDMLDWSIEARRALYEGLMDGDGSRKETQHAEAFWSKDQDHRDVFLALALSIGVRCYEDPVKGVVYVNQKTRTTQVQNKQRADRLPYKGKVWCLTVPTGAFVVRRSGRPFITGNSGFPKAHAADKAIDKTLGVKGGFVAEGAPVKRMIPGADQHRDGSWINGNGREYQPGSYVPGSLEAAQWEGWAYGTQAQKPALEPIYLGQKPFSEKTGAANLLKHGVGAVNIDGCRVPSETGGRPLREVAALRDDVEYNGISLSGRADGSLQSSKAVGITDQGRHPANLILDGSPEVVAMFPSTGKSSGGKGAASGLVDNESIYGSFSGENKGRSAGGFGDEGSAARFFHQFGPDSDPLFYHPKAGKLDRAGSRHPTVKPIALMQYLMRHITSPGGTVLDPFAGSGTTAEAAQREGFDCILMEAEPEYVEFLEQRFNIDSDDCATESHPYLELLGIHLSSA